MSVIFFLKDLNMLYNIFLRNKLHRNAKCSKNDAN